MEPPTKKQRLETPPVRHRVALIPRKQVLDRPHLIFEWTRVCNREKDPKALMTINDTDVKLSQESREGLRLDEVPSLVFLATQKLSQDPKFKSKDPKVNICLRAYGAVRGCQNMVTDHRLRRGEYIEACLSFSGFDRRSKWFEVSEWRNSVAG